MCSSDTSAAAGAPRLRSADSLTLPSRLRLLLGWSLRDAAISCELRAATGSAAHAPCCTDAGARWAASSVCRAAQRSAAQRAWVSLERQLLALLHGAALHQRQLFALKRTWFRRALSSRAGAHAQPPGRRATRRARLQAARMSSGACSAGCWALRRKRAVAAVRSLPPLLSRKLRRAARITLQLRIRSAGVIVGCHGPRLWPALMPGVPGSCLRGPHIRCRSHLSCRQPGVRAAGRQLLHAVHGAG